MTQSTIDDRSSSAARRRVTVVVGIAFAAGCGGGGGGSGATPGAPLGGGPNAPGGQTVPTTPAPEPVIDRQIAASPNPATAGETVTMTARGSYAKGGLTSSARQVGGTSVVVTSVLTSEDYSGTFTAPAVAASETITFIVDFLATDGKAKSTNRIDVTVNPVPTGGGGGGGSTPTAPAITAFSTESGLPLEVDKPVQTGWVNTNLTGYSESQVTVKVNDNGTRYDGSVLRFRAIDGVEVELPELSTPGQKTIELYFDGIATPATVAVQYEPASTGMFVVNRDNEFFNGGAYAAGTISGTGAADIPYESGQINGHFNKAGFAPTQRPGEFFAGAEASSSSSVQVFLYRAGSQTGPLRITTGTPNDQGLIESIASTPDRTKCAVLWSDPTNSRGAFGGAKRYLSIVDSNLSSPSVLVPLDNVEGVSSGQMTPVQVVTLGIDGMGGDQFQPYAVWATRVAPYKLYMVPLDNNPQSTAAYEFSLAVCPQVLHFYRDRGVYCLSVMVVGLNSITNKMEKQPVDFTRNGVLVWAKDELFPATTDAIGADFHTEEVVETAATPTTPAVTGIHSILTVAIKDAYYCRTDLSAAGTPTTNRPFSGPAMKGQQFVVLPGIGFAVVAVGGGVAELHISEYGDFDNPTVNVTTAESNALGVCGRDVVWTTLRPDQIRTYHGPAYDERVTNFVAPAASPPASFFSADR